MSSFYRETYLKSEHWQNLRLQKLVESDCLCLRCGKQSHHNDVHHLTYKKLYDVKTVDLVVLCRKCHDFVHEKLDQVNLLTEEDPHEKAAAVWKLFLETWGPHPNDHVELRTKMVALRKAGKMGPKINPVERVKKKRPPGKTVFHKVRLPLSAKEFSIYDARAAEEGLWIQDWIAQFLRERIAF